MDTLRYFPHDVTAASDSRVRKLIHRLGAEGYGRWWALLEALAREGGSIRAECDEDWRVLAEACLMPYEDAKGAMAFVGTLGELGLVDARALGDGTVTNARMRAFVEEAERKHARLSEAGRAGGRKSRRGPSRAGEGDDKPGLSEA